MTQLIIDLEGNILFDKNNPIISLEEIRESIDTAFFRELIPGIITPLDNLLYYKVALADATGYKIFVAKAGYPLDDILRDILRFLILDILILVPFYFMGKYFVRETLEPVGANIEAMNDFIHDAGHELKTPLAIISGNLQILRDEKEKDPTLINESISTLHAMSTSLDGLLELSSLKLPEKIQSTNLVSCLEWEIQTLKQYIDEKNITIETKIDKKTLLRINDAHLSLLLSNILKNAIIYNKNDGNITISYRKGILEFRDTGIGIAKKDLEKIWERFYRGDHSGKYSGSGIGLSIVERIARLYGWNIEVTSTLGEGTIFTIHTL